MKNTINLLPKKSPEEKKAKRKQKITIAFVLATFLLLLLVWGALFLQKENLRREGEDLHATISQKEKSIESMFETEYLYRTVYSKSSAASALLENKETFLRNIDNVEAYINPGLSIKDITVDTQGASLLVVATDISVISDYLKKLEDEGRRKQIFKNLVLSQIALDRAGGYQVGIEGVLVDE